MHRARGAFHAAYASSSSGGLNASSQRVFSVLPKKIKKYFYTKVYLRVLKLGWGAKKQCLDLVGIVNLDLKNVLALFGLSLQVHMVVNINQRAMCLLINNEPQSPCFLVLHRLGVHQHVRKEKQFDLLQKEAATQRLTTKKL